MICFTRDETADWLARYDVTPSPYGKSKQPAHYIQFRLPPRSIANFAFIRSFLKLTDGEVLVDVTDWPLYEPAEMVVVDSLRREHGEQRNLIDAPGHALLREESELAIAIYGSAGNFQWNSYLYLPNDLATLYNWEGDLYDFWTKDLERLREMQNLVDDFDLQLENGG